MKYLKKKKHLSLWKVIVLDILLLGVILLTFAFFHHGMDFIKTSIQQQQSVQNPTEPSETEPTEATEDLTQPTEQTASVETTEATEATEPTEPDLRTEWQKKFEDKFTEDVVVTDNSYTSPTVSITIHTMASKENGRPLTYYLADIYVASLDNFRSRFAYGEYRPYGAQDAVSLSKDANAILAISGDFSTMQRSGFNVRNGEVIYADHNNTVCVLYKDGTMETYDQGTYVIDDILARDPLHVWSFGPALLDENGKVKSSYDAASGISGAHPRSAVGYFEPGHYCFIVVDGRQDHSHGLTISELAKVFEELGCKAAYNLDGGATAVMLFNNEIFSHPSNGGRNVGDILFIAESAATEEQEVTE